MTDWFLILLAYSVVPILFPVASIGAAEHALFSAWAVGQVVLVLVVTAVLIKRVVRSRWPTTRFAVAAWTVVSLAAALYYGVLAWDAVVVYDRMVTLSMQYRGLWSAYAHAGTSYVMGYPPGASLSVMWGRLLHLPSSNMTNVAMIWLWLTSFLVTWIEPAGNRRSAPLFVLLFLVAPDVIWHVVNFYNNIFYALLWTQLIVGPLLRRPLGPWEKLAHAFLLVTFRPQAALAVVPVVCGALVECLVDRVDRKRLGYSALALVLVLLGSRLWELRSVQLEALQRKEAAEEVRLETAGRDPAVLDILIGPPASRPSTVTGAVPRRRWDVYREAIAWAWDTSMQKHRVAIVGLMLLAAVSLLLGWRWALAGMVPLLTPLTFIVGTAPFAWGWPAYQDIPSSLQRLQLMSSTCMAALAVALESEICRRFGSRSPRSNGC